ncbi:hypothetical protein MKW98_006312 [Papaver atlanticum]|uniref:Uncharacterized protein n=1 Tax=Papaver atlanticum TaxID=357466 RepID=A0AAD4TGN2_9MAGN|nr:hypothetical protein MKW98_006312 [Papaver atlanticum]
MDKGFNNGPAGRVYELLSGLTLMCSFSCFYLSYKPSAFFAEVCLCLGLVFKGTWVLQGGLNLYTDAFSLKGCQRISLSDKKINLLCDVEEDGYRGVALINFLFVGHAVLVLLMHFVLFGVLNCNKSMRIGEGVSSGSCMSEIESQSLLVHPLPEFEIE